MLWGLPCHPTDRVACSLFSSYTCIDPRGQSGGLRAASSAPGCRISPLAASRPVTGTGLAGQSGSLLCADPRERSRDSNANPAPADVAPSTTFVLMVERGRLNDWGFPVGSTGLSSCRKTNDEKHVPGLSEGMG